MRKTKQGVSLIVLVITIIVMIILAAAVMISLSNTGILNKANDAVDATNLKEIQNIAGLAWSEAYIDTMDMKDQDERLQKIDEAVKAAVSKVDTSGKFTVTVTMSGADVVQKVEVPADWKASVREVTQDGVPIPIGFVKSPYDGEGTKDEGLVIYALKPEEIGKKTTITDDYQTALETRNQFVWVPVDSNNFKDLFIRQNFGTDNLISNTVPSETQYSVWELELDDNNMPKSTQNEEYVSADTLKEATAMYESVKKYGGFYIARYEAGTTSTYKDSSNGHIATRVSIDAGTNANLSVTMAKYPYDCVSWGTSMSDETSDNGAVSLARNFYPSEGTNPYGVISTLTYGVQWDRTIAWWIELNSNIDLTNSTDYGVYYSTTISSTELNANAKYSIFSSYACNYGTWGDITSKDSSGEWLLTTGAYTKANIYNIYDMAGNLQERTMEEACYYTANTVSRGGRFNTSIPNPVTYRDCYSSPHTTNSTNGFRPSLYIK